MSGSARWVLAFDASCEACRGLSTAVGQACGGRLEVRPLTQPDVQRWRVEALGPHPPWTPTLLRVTPDSVRAWTGAAMAVRLARRLGPRATVRVLGSLGEPARVDGPGLSRAGFLRLGLGAVVAGGLVLGGRTSALAARTGAGVSGSGVSGSGVSGTGVSGTGVEGWLAAHRDHLPERYDDVVAYAMPYRRAIHAASPPAVRNALWTEQLARYRAAHTALTAAQRAVLDQGTALLAGRYGHTELEQLRERAVHAYGLEEARSLLATLGPASAASARKCGCNVVSDWCRHHCHGCCWDGLGCDNLDCLRKTGCCCVMQPDGCGTFWQYVCDGVCGD